MKIEYVARTTALYSNSIRAVLYSLVLLAAIVFCSAAQAGSEWTVVTIEGDAKIVKEGIQPIALNTGDRISEGDRVVTGETGRAILSRGGSTIVVAPGSEMSIPVEQSGGLATRILQKVGTLFLQVEKKKTEHFEVLTPYLTAVVKGTSFTVNVDRAGAAVHVLEGLVQVADTLSQQTVFVRPGQTASRGAAAGGLDLQGKKAAAPGKKADTAQTEPSAAGNDNGRVDGDNSTRSAAAKVTNPDKAKAKAGDNNGTVRSADAKVKKGKQSNVQVGENSNANVGKNSTANVAKKGKAKVGKKAAGLVANVAGTAGSGVGQAAQANQAVANIAGAEAKPKTKKGHKIGKTLGVVSVDVATVSSVLPGNQAAKAVSAKKNSAKAKDKSKGKENGNAKKTGGTTSVASIGGSTATGSSSGGSTAGTGSTAGGSVSSSSIGSGSVGGGSVGGGSVGGGSVGGGSVGGGSVGGGSIGGGGVSSSIGAGSVGGGSVGGGSVGGGSIGGGSVGGGVTNSVGLGNIGGNGNGNGNGNANGHNKAKKKNNG
jgi:hypothetical protein